MGASQLGLADLVKKISKSFQIPNWNYVCQELPVFTLQSSQVKILCKPQDFYKELIEKASSAKKRIVLASLYIGTDKLEQNLVTTIRKQLISEPKLQVKWLLDFTRSSRNIQNSRTLLLPMIKEKPQSCKVALYHTPSLRGLLKFLIPERFNETIGLQHMKVYVFDDSVIMSGANLSNDYFVNRQDRYVVLENCAPLAQFYEELVDVVSFYSLQLNSSDEAKMNNNCKVHPFLGSYTEFCDSMRKSVERFWQSQYEKSRQRLIELKNSPEEVDTLVFPTIQMPDLNLNIDSSTTQDLIKSAPLHSRLHFATGYFNLTNEYMNSILKTSQASYNIICAHPKANGFLGAKGIAGAIPAAYTNLCKLFYNRVHSMGRGNRIYVSEYQKEGWTFHAKGLWYFAPGDKLPSTTMIGSPNFGYRSVHRDLETQIILTTLNDGLIQQMDNEQRRLCDSSKVVNGDTFKSPDRVVLLWVKVFTFFMKRFF